MTINTELLAALKDALEDIEHWGMYASEYFQSKHNLAGDIAKYRSIIATAESAVSEPVAYIRKWAFEKEKPVKERKENGRLAWPFKFKLLPVTKNQCLPDDVPLYATLPAAAVSEPMSQLAAAWSEGYKMGISDERTSEANIGIAGFNAKVEPARNNPYGIPVAAVSEPVKPIAWVSAVTGDLTLKDMSHTVSWAPLYTTPPAAVPQWMPIESAPKEGAKVLIVNDENEMDVAYYVPDFYTRQEFVRTAKDGDVYKTVQEECGYWETKAYNSTHWMPLPPPPNIGAKE